MSVESQKCHLTATSIASVAVPSIGAIRDFVWNPTRLSGTALEAGGRASNRRVCSMQMFQENFLCKRLTVGLGP